jgi:MOSC domain-containing protein YiiM
MEGDSPSREVAHPTPRVISVNVGVARDVKWRGEVVRTGIWKYAVEGRVALRGVNLDGDDQADRTVHGGPDKAVYAYARADYDVWRDEHGIETAPGLFGENLTLEGVDLSSAVAGERWRVGSTVLEVLQPRLPCYKLGIRMGDSRFPKRFQAVGRMGAYFRIVREGDVGAGDTMEIVSRPDHGVSLRDFVLALHDRSKAESLKRVARLPAFWRHVADGR